MKKANHELYVSQEILGELRGILQENHRLADHTSWRIGGNARYFYQPADLNDLSTFLKIWPYKENLLWLGAGSNVLVPDQGIDGTVIYVRNCLNILHQLDDSEVVRVEAGVGCARFVQYGAQLGWEDCAFLAGIPGTIGGAMAMNAGAFGDDIWGHIIAVETIDDDGEIYLREAEEFQFEYRKVTGLSTNEWFVAGYLRFKPGNQETTGERIKELINKRKASQPYDKFSCGSVFKNPPGDYAARLIEACGLKGKRIGGAEISEKHANFIVNSHGATAKDIKELISQVTKTVKKQHGIKLELEVKVL